MKILIVSDAWLPQLNGVVRTYEYLIPPLCALGHDVRVIGPADFRFVVPLPGYKEIKLALFTGNLLEKLFKDAPPSHLHIATEGPLGRAAMRVGKKLGLDISTCYHTHFPDYVAKRVRKIFPPLANPLRKFSIASLRRFHSRARVMFVATDSLKEELHSWDFTVPMAPLTRGVDKNIFHPGSKNLFGGLPRPVALYVGRIAIEKSIEDFLQMPWQGSKVVVGHGPDLEKLKKKYPDAIFTGKKTGMELGDHYRSADVFVFPSRTDTFGMVLIEAMACGLPIAAYNVTGPKDIVTNDCLGAVGDDLAAAAQKALQYGTAEQRHAHVHENYTWEKAAGQFISAAGRQDGPPRIKS